jgi:hypothetical protein
VSSSLLTTHILLRYNSQSPFGLAFNIRQQSELYFTTIRFLWNTQGATAGIMPTASNPSALVFLQSTDIATHGTCNQDQHCTDLAADQTVMAPMQHADTGSAAPQSEDHHAQASTVPAPIDRGPTSPRTEADLGFDRSCKLCFIKFEPGDETVMLIGHRCHAHCVCDLLPAPNPVKAKVKAKRRGRRR